MNKKIFVPSKNTESWKELLTIPEKHWKDSRSAKSTATSWEKNNDIPIEIKNALSKNKDFIDSELLLAIPKFEVSLNINNSPSQNDIMFLTSNKNYLSVFTVEANINESFDNTISSWLNIKLLESKKEERLEFLLRTIRFQTQEYSELRYQFFHRLASAVIMAEKFHADKAVMIIQSFEESDKKNHYNDFSNFVKAYDCIPVKEKLIKLTSNLGIDIYALWVYSKY